MSSRTISILISFFVIIFGIGIFSYFLITKFTETKKQEELQNQIIKEKEENLKKQKEISLVEVVENKQIIEKEIIEKNKDIQEKIRDLKQKNNSIANFKLDNLGEFYFIDIEGRLGLYNSGKKLGEYKKSDFIDLKEIIGIEDFIFFQIGEEKYLYNLNTDNYIKLDIKINIEYIKIGKSNQEFLFKTKVGIFVYDLVNNKFNYFNYFVDFIYFNNGYLGIIQKDDKIRFNNLSIKNNNKDIIFYYNPTTKQKNIMYQTDLSLNKIYENNGKIFFEDITGGKYKLENIK